MILSLLLAGSLYAPGAQDTSQVQALVQLAAAGPQESLVAQVGRYPDAARDAFSGLLRQSVRPPASGQDIERDISDAETLARAYFDAWTDAFLIQELGRFRMWSMAERRAKLAADSLRLAGNKAYGRTGITEAMRLWRQGLVASRSVGDEPGVYRVLGNIGAGWYSAGDLDSARAYLNESYRGATGVNDLRTAAAAVTNLANLAYELNELAQAADLYSQASDLLARTGSYRFQSITQHNLALVSMALGDLRGARSALEESIRLSRLHGYPDDEAEGLATLADLARLDGEYREAAGLLERSLALSGQTGHLVAEAAALHSMGLLWMARGDYRKAEGYLERSLAAYVELDQLPNAVDVREALARTLTAAGDLRGGVGQLQIAQRLADSLALGPLRMADLTLAAADLNLALNDYARAADLFRQAQTDYRQANDLLGQSSALEGQGYLSIVRGDAHQAVDLLERALGMQARGGVGAGGPDPRSNALTRLYLAVALEETGEVALARETLHQARQGLASVGDVVGEAAVLATLGGLELRAGLPGTADSLYRAGLALLGANPAPDVAWQLHAGLAEALEGTGDLAGAVRELRLSAGAIERSAATLLMVEEQTAFRADKADVYDRLAELELRSGDLNAAFEVSERARAQQTLALVSRGRIDVPKQLPADLLDREQDLRQRIGDLTMRLRRSEAHRTTLREPMVDVTLSATEIRAALTRAQRDYADVLAQIRALAPDYATLVDPVPASLDDVSALLGPGQTFVEYLLLDSVTIAFVVTRDTAAALLLDVGRESVADLVDFARGVIARGDKDRAGELWRTPLRRLHDDLFAPIEQTGLVADGATLVIVPHGVLHYLPFQALLGPEGEGFLVERYAIAYAPSASSWVRIAGRASTARANRMGPIEGDRVLALAPRVDQLPGSRYEVDVIGRLFGEDADILLGPDASEEAFRGSVGGYDIVHLATYGVLNKANPLFSFVELAGSTDDASRLEVHEIYGLELTARLLTLSACETALGSSSRWDVPPGDDWVSLAGAFLGAGAENVLASLWQVEDLATAELMQQFYRRFKAGSPFTHALAQAQRGLLAHPDTAHPFFWAGFVLVGEGGVI